MPFTVVKKDSVTEIQQVLNQETVKQYRLPDITSSVHDNSRNGETLFDEIGPLNMYNKKIGRVDYRITPCNLNTQNAFWLKDTLFRNLLIKYPIIYRADEVTDIKNASRYYTTGKKIAFLADDIKVENTRSDSTASITLKTFTPNSWNMKISSKAPGVYTVFQNYYPNWKLYIDGKESKVFLSNISFIGFFLEKGTHDVSLKYEAPLVKISFLISLACLIIMIFILLKR
jgi:hypothetical protein